MKNLDLLEIELVLKKEIKKTINFKKFKNIFFLRRNSKFTILFLLLIPIFFKNKYFQIQLLTKINLKVIILNGKKLILSIEIKKKLSGKN